MSRLPLHLYRKFEVRSLTMPNDERQYRKASTDRSGGDAQQRASEQTDRLVQNHRRTAELVEGLGQEHDAHSSPVSAATGTADTDTAVRQLGAMTSLPHDPSDIESMADAARAASKPRR